MTDYPGLEGYALDAVELRCLAQAEAKGNVSEIVGLIKRSRDEAARVLAARKPGKIRRVDPETMTIEPTEAPAPVITRRDREIYEQAKGGDPRRLADIVTMMARRNGIAYEQCLKLLSEPGE